MKEQKVEEFRSLLGKILDFDPDSDPNNRLVINGGRQDAGDLSQGLGKNGEAVYAMFSLAERLRARDKVPELYERLRHKPSVHILGESIKLLEDVHLIIILPMPAGPGCCAAAVSLSFRPSQLVIRIRT